MRTQEGEAPPELYEALERILRHYTEPYFVRRDIEVGGAPVAALAEMQMREPKRLFGFSTPGMKLGESVAGEFLLFIVEDVLTVPAAERMVALVEAARRELFHPEDDHSYTIFSVAALTGAVEPDAARVLKRLRSPGGFQAGWTMTRLVAVCPAQGKIFCSPDGKDLGRLLLTRLK